MRVIAAILILLTALSAVIITTTPSVRADIVCESGELPETYTTLARIDGEFDDGTQHTVNNGNPIITNASCLPGDQQIDQEVRDYYRPVDIVDGQYIYSVTCRYADYSDRTIDADHDPDSPDSCAEARAKEAVCPQGYIAISSYITSTACEATSGYTVGIQEYVRSATCQPDVTCPGTGGETSCDPETGDCTCSELNQQECSASNACVLETSGFSGTLASADGSFELNLSQLEYLDNFRLSVRYDGTSFEFNYQMLSSNAPPHTLASNFQTEFQNAQNLYNVDRQGTRLTFVSKEPGTELNGETIRVREITNSGAFTRDEIDDSGWYTFTLSGGVEPTESYTCREATCADVNQGGVCYGSSWDNGNLVCTPPEEGDGNSLCCPEGQIVNATGECSEPPKAESEAERHIITLREGGDLNAYACGASAGDQEIVTYQTLCDEIFESPNQSQITQSPESTVQAGPPQGFTCSITSDGWNWTQTHTNISLRLVEEEDYVPEWQVTGGIEQMTPSDADTEERIQHFLGNNTDVILPEGVAIACDNETNPRTATLTRDRTGLNTGQCSSTQCYANQRCYQPGARVDDHYVCRYGQEGAAAWTSGVTLLADEMSNYVPSNRDYSINCGDAQTVLNQEREDSNVYCELRVFQDPASSGVDHILTGVLFSQDQEVVERSPNTKNIQFPNFFDEELRKIHSDYTTQPNPEHTYLDYQVLPYNIELAYALFTDHDEFGTQTSPSIWRRITSIFTSTNPGERPDTRSGERFYFDSRGDTRFIAQEYRDDECEQTQRKVLFTQENGVECYDENTYRRYIQQR